VSLGEQPGRPSSPPCAAEAASRPAADSVRPLGAVFFIYFGFIGLFNTYSPLWLASLGLSTVAIGALSSLQAWTRVVSPYAWGWLADHTQRRERVLRSAVVLNALGACVLCLPWMAPDVLQQPMAWLVPTVLWMFLANGGVTPLVDSALAQRMKAGGSGVDAGRYGRVRLWGSLGFILAVVGTGAVLQALGVTGFPALVVVVALLLCVVAWRALVPAAASGPSGSKPKAWPVLCQPVVAWFFASVAFTVLAHTALYAFFSLYLAGLGYGKAAIGLIWALGVLAEIGFFWFQGRFFRRISSTGWLVIAASVMVLRMAALAAFGHWVPVLLACALSHCLTFAAHHSACVAVLAQHFRGDLRGRGMALYSVLGYGLPGVVGGLAGGWMFDAAGAASVFWAASGAALLGAVCAWRMSRLSAN
jgi:MFS transporter, PPP family, 3-phenylpropionic acid transporter